MKNASGSTQRVTSDEHGPGGRGPWLLVAGFVVLAALIVGLALVAWREQARTMRATTDRSLNAVADLKADQIAAWSRERRGDAAVIRSDRLLSAAVDDLLSGQDEPTIEAAIAARLAAVQEQYGYVDITLVRPDGTVLLRRPEDATHDLGAPARALVRKAVRTGQVESTDLYLDATGQTRLDVVVPVLGDQRDDPAMAAVVLHTDPMHFLYPLVQGTEAHGVEWPLRATSGEVLLVARDGDNVLYLSELRHRAGAALKLTAPASDPDLPSAKAVRGETGVVEGVDYRGVPVVAALSPVPETPWFIVAKVDTREVLDPIARRAWMTMGFTLLVVALAAGGALLLWRARETRVTAGLAASETRFRSLFESMAEGVVLHELVRATSSEPVDYRILAVNPAFSRQTGMAAETVRGRLGTEAYGTPSAPFLERYAQAVTDGEPRQFETYFEPLGRHFSISVVPQGEGRFATIFEDITARQRAEDEIKRLNADLERRVAERTAELDAANKELEAFAYTVSHDLRAPLRHMSGFSSLLASRAGDSLDEKSRHYVATISKSVREMGELIDDLLRFSRTGRAELKIEPVDTNATLAEALAPLMHEADGRAIEWSIDPLPSVVGDHALLRQVWANLLSNAVKYTRGRTPARIAVGGYEADGEVVLFVRDNGVGFDVKYAHKLFGVFQRLHSASEFEGTGIGLANVQRIITRLGGRAWAESEMDQGATFFFPLPRQKERGS